MSVCALRTEPDLCGKRGSPAIACHSHKVGRTPHRPVDARRVSASLKGRQMGTLCGFQVTKRWDGVGRIVNRRLPPGASYTVRSCCHLVLGPWTEEETISSEGESTSWIDRDPTSVCTFYRIEIKWAIPCGSLAGVWLEKQHLRDRCPGSFRTQGLLPKRSKSRRRSCRESPFPQFPAKRTIFCGHHPAISVSQGRWFVYLRQEPRFSG
jgi:hypothetical protein